MNIIRKDIDELNALLEVELTKDDYLPKVNDALKKIKKQAHMKGFRPGMVPIGLVKKMYGKAVIVDEIEKQLQKSVQDYIKEHEVNLLFNPLIVPDKTLDFSIQEPVDYTFIYEVGLAPEFELNYKDKSVFKYNIETSEHFIQDELISLRKRFGIQNEVNPPIGDSDILSIKLEELNEDGLIKEAGIESETSIAVDFIKDENIKAEVMQLDLDQQMSINLKKAFDREEEHLLKFMLGVEGEEAENLGMDYQLTLLGVKRIELAEMSLGFFEQVYNDPEISTEEQFMERFREDFKELSESRSEERLKLDIQDLLMDNTMMDFPEDFLKKYFKQSMSNEESSAEKIEETINKEFDDIIKRLKWEQIVQKITSDNDIVVEQTDIRKRAIADTKEIYLRYMNYEITDEMALNFSSERLKNQEYLKDIFSRIMEDRLFEVLFKEIKTEPQDITFEEFAKLS